MMKLCKFDSESGVTLIIFALLLVVFLAFTALAVDIAHLYVVKNELQNAADSGALAGTRCLYDCMEGVTPGTTVNQNANQFAFNAATANKSERVTVEVGWVPGQNIGSDIERGHWRFRDRTFHPSDEDDPPTLWNVSSTTLDEDLNFVNAVRVKTKRENIKADSYFARIMGFFGFDVAAEAVAYIGFAGKLESEEVDQPFAFCKQALTDPNGNYICGVGRMISNSQTNDNKQTGGWTDFSQPEGCNTASQQEVYPYVCGDGNLGPLFFGDPMQTNNGMTTNIDKVSCCWMSQNDANPDYEQGNFCQHWNNGSYAPPTEPWEMVLPVVDCPDGNSLSGCPTLVGAVKVNFIWATDSNDCNASQIDDRAPRQMGDWVAPDGATGIQAWDSFVNAFDIRIQRPDGSFETALYANGGCMNNSFYFNSECGYFEPKGGTGGQNFGILAKIPVLVD